MCWSGTSKMDRVSSLGWGPPFVIRICVGTWLERASPNALKVSSLLATSGSSLGWSFWTQCVGTADLAVLVGCLTRVGLWWGSWLTRKLQKYQGFVMLIWKTWALVQLPSTACGIQLLLPLAALKYFFVRRNFWNKTISEREKKTVCTQMLFSSCLWKKISSARVKSWSLSYNWSLGFLKRKREIRDQQKLSESLPPVFVHNCLYNPFAHNKMLIKSPPTI